MAFLPVQGVDPVVTPVFSPRTAEGLSVTQDDGESRTLVILDSADTTPGDTELMSLLAIDGNRDGKLVLFDHAGHVERTGGDTSCAVCHHLDIPLDRNSSCYECHRDMYEPTSLFNHASHVRKLDGNNGCSQCHDNNASVKDYQTAAACTECHKSKSVPQPIIEVPNERWRDAPGYTDAMHGLCITCHQRKVAQSPQRYPAVLERCDNCHDEDRALELGLVTSGSATNGQMASRQR